MVKAKAGIFNYQFFGMFFVICIFMTSCIGWGGSSNDKEIDGNSPLVIVQETSVLLGDSVHVEISLPGYATNPAPAITIDSVNGVKIEQPVIVHGGIGYYNELSTKEGTNVFAGIIIAKEKNSNKVDTFYFRSTYTVIKSR